MNDHSIALTQPPAGYADWLAELKARIHSAQQRATLAVNRELVLLYWQIGQHILTRQAAQGWGAKVIERLAHDLRNAFPEMKGFSRANLMYMRAFAEAWPDEQIVQQAVGQLPLPPPGSDLARESLKDPYLFDFLDVGKEADEREIESALVEHITQFLLELGAGFAFVGRQVLLDVGGDEFFIDLLFYHLKLRCYVVIELKTGKFKPEHLGQLGFYMTAVDKQIKHELDNATIGLLLCKSKNKVVAEYALGDKTQPMGIAEYKLVEALPENLKTNLPSIEQIERELQGDEA
ncbi:DUF1016 domain-containing protein [Acidithiobacillus thiooxidans]|jgi:predicted nuclease of restriction endonuclease-like (RecB) superfamily|uniref:PDDEXK nuclease domain-containing protein n=1 Tax=Acidithiobacillus thiooxidans TaxID=930 RepID=UPI001C077A6E|nr:PDDEXK nuclease domain-containing protein [Acidithiobacillus thiooxidans]MBU2839081.1 DUF1016 domain-containing protein [Acidithiobacillus thiooxidans]